MNVYIAFYQESISFWRLLLVMLESQQALKLLEENRERVDTRSEFTLAWQRLNVISSSFNH